MCGEGIEGRTMNKKFCDILFFLICATLCFTDVPMLKGCSFVFGSLAYKVSIYPIFVGLIYTLYCQWRYKNVFVDWNKFKWFAYIYIGFTIISIVLGLYSFPYWEELLVADNAKQISSHQMAYNWLQACGFKVSYETMQMLLLGSYPLRVFLKNFLFYFGAAYMVYCWYKTDWYRGFKAMMAGCLTGLFIVMAYGVLDIFYLAHCPTATELLKLINPYVHEICTSHGWWPPLLGYNGLRSVFAEPSYLGAWSTMVIPFLFFSVLDMKKPSYKILSVFVLTIFFFEMFLTQSRSCMLVLIAELAAMFFCLIWQYRKEYVKKILIILATAGFAFCISIYFYGKYMQNQVDRNATMNSNISSYIDNNVGSIVNSTKRSNGTRLATILADLQIFRNNFLLGIGNFHRSIYIREIVTKNTDNTGEMQMWIKCQKEQGILKSGYPELTEYTSRLANYGIVGFPLFFFPLVFVFFKFLKNCLRRQSSLEEITCLTGFTGLLVVGVAYKFSNLIGYYCLLGIAYAILYGKKSNTIEL